MIVFLAIVARMLSAAATACFAVAVVRVELGLRDRGLCKELPGALQVDMGQVGVRLGGAQLRLLGRRVLPDQDVSRLHPASRLEIDLDDLAVELGGDRDALDRGRASRPR